LTPEPTWRTQLDWGAGRPSYSNVDATVGWRDRSWDVDLFARNLTNALQIQAINAGFLAEKSTRQANHELCECSSGTHIIEMPLMEFPEFVVT